jgi:hypothetical protein
MDFIQENWSELLVAVMVLLGTVSALTDSEDDDRWVDLLNRIVQAVIFGRSKGPKNPK